ncbi:MAG: PAS domain S-box protein [Candidatus Sericytochromatia bacterium]
MSQLANQTYEELLNENKQLKEQLKNKDIYLNILNAMPHLFFILDLDGYFLDYKGSENLKTYIPKNSIIGKNIKEIFDVNLVENFFSSINKLSENNNNISFKYQLLEDNKINYYDSKLILTIDNKILAIVRNITEEIELKKNIENINSKYNYLIENSPDGIVLIGLDGYFKYTSPAMRKIFGYSEEELLKTKPEELTHPDDLSIIMKNIKKIIENPLLNPTIRYRFKDKQNNWHWVEGVFSNSISTPEINAIVVNFRDITENLNNEEKLKKLEGKYKVILEKSPDGIVLISPDGKFNYISSSIIKIFGYSQEEIVNLKPDSLTHPEDLPMVLDNLTKLLGDNSFTPTIEYRFIDKWGKWHWVQSTFTNLIEEPYIESIVINFKDITDKKETEIKLKESEEKFFKIFQASRSMLILTKFDDGLIVDVNETFLKISGYNKEEIIGKKSTEINLWTDIKNRDEYIELLKRNGYTENLEYKFLLKSGEERIGSVFGQIIEINAKKYILGSINDITEQKILQNYLDLERIRLATLMNTIPDLIWLKDIDGVYLSCNKKFSKFYGAEEKDIIGKTDYDFVDKDLADFFRKNDKKALEANHAVTNYEWLTYSNDSHTELNQTIKTPMYNDKNELIGVLGVARDITELNNYQEKLKEREELYSSIVKQAQDSIALIDPVSCKFIEFNDIAFESLGYTKEEFYSLTLMDIQNQLSKEEVLNMFVNNNNKYYIFESKHTCKDGRIKDVRISVSPVTIKNKKYHSAIWSDITNIKEIQNKLEEQKNFLELLLNSMPNLVFWKDINLTYQGCNKVFANIIGLSNTSEVIGLNDYDLNSFDKEECSKSDKKILETGKELINLEESYLDSNGKKGVILTSKVPIKNSDNKVIGVLGISIDITEREKAKFELIESERKLKEAQVLAKLGHWELELLNKKLSWSDEIYNIFEVDKNIKDNLYDVFNSIIHPNDLTFVDNAYNESILNKTKYDIVHRLLMKDGRIKYVHEKCNTEYDKYNHPIRSLGTVQDITETILIQKEIKDLNQTLEKKVKERTEQLEIANKDLEAFAYSVSHDLRAPLRHIDGFSRLLERVIKDKSPEAENFFGKIFNSINKMSGMIDELLKFSRLGRKVLEKLDVDLNIIVEQVINQYKIETEHRNLEYKIGKLPIVKLTITHKYNY